MSRSNPNESLPNPAAHWLEWNGEVGNIRYYDKAKQENVSIALPFTFLLLDELGSVRGWHDASQSGIYSNEVRDTRSDVLVVKAFKGGTIAEGLYRDIKEAAKAAGGRFTSTCYIAMKNGGDHLSIAALQIKGAALNAWMDFRKDNRASLYKKAITIDGFTEGKKGRVVFRAPTFKLKDISEQSNAEAVTLDQTLQEFLTAYLARTKRDQAEVAAPAARHAEEPAAHDITPNDDDIPF